MPDRLRFARLVITAIGLIGILSSAFGASCSSTDSSKPLDSIILAYSPFESTGLLWIAEDQQFFKRNGIAVTLSKYDTGAGALDGMLKGEADIAMGTAEFPVVIRAFRKEKMRIIGNADKADFIYVIARKGSGIEKITDLKGKRVGTTFGTIAHFHLGRLLNLKGISIQDVTLVDLKTPEEWVNAVAEGKVDALATAQPYAHAAKERLGVNALFWPAQSGQLLYGLIISSDNWITENPDLTRRFLESLSQAEDYLNRNPEGARAIVQKGLNLDDAYIEAFWSQNQFGLSLDQSLIAAMEDEARWVISNNLTAEKTTPDFSDYIYKDALKAVSPEAVNINP